MAHERKFTKCGGAMLLLKHIRKLSLRARP